jgi:hypothetical protein
VDLGAAPNKLRPPGLEALRGRRILRLMEDRDDLLWGGGLLALPIALLIVAFIFGPIALFIVGFIFGLGAYALIGYHPFDRL